MIDFNQLWKNATDMVKGGKDIVTPNFDMSNPTPSLGSTDSNMFGLKNNSTGGIISNTITGLPRGLYDVSKKVTDTLSEIPGQTLNTAMGVGGDILNVFKQPKDKIFSIPAPLGLNNLPGFGKTIETPSSKVARGEQTLKDYGFGKTSLPLAFGGTIASTVLDLTPFGGEKNAVKGFAGGVPEAFWKFIGKTIDKKVLEETFIKIGVKDKNLIKDLVEVSAPTKTAREAQSAIENTWNSRIKNIEAPKSFNDFTPETQTKLLEFSDAVATKKTITPETITSLRNFFKKEGLELPPTTKGIADYIDTLKETVDYNAIQKTLQNPPTQNILDNAKNIISKGKESVIQSKITTPSIIAPIIKTSDRIIPTSIPQKRGLTERVKDYYNSLPNKQGGFARVPDFEGMAGLPQSEQNKILREIRGDVLKNDPARDLNKHFGKSFDTISQQLENYKGTSRATFIQDKVSELGYKNIDEAQIALDKYKAVSKDIKGTRYSAEGIKLATPASMKAKLEKQTIQKLATKESPLSSPIQAITGSTGEVRSIERMAEQQATQQIRDPQLKKSVSLSNIIQKTQTPVKSKVNMLDYVRTPEKVLKKLGLQKEADAIRVGYDAYIKELPKNLDTITKWAKSLQKDSNTKVFKYLDGQAIDLHPKEMEVVTEVKAWLKEWADRLGLPEDKRIADYITHIFDKELLAKEFDEDLAKIIADKVPGTVYNPFLQARLGAKGYREDTWAALDAYVKRATRKVHMDPALAKLEDASNHLEESQWNYVKRYADRINMRPTEWDNLIDNGIKSVIGYRAGQRPIAAISKGLRQATYRGMLGINPGSALRNLSQGVNTYAKLGEKYTAIGYSKLFNKANMLELEQSGVLNPAFIQDRSLSAIKTKMQKADKVLFYMFEKAEKINRGAAYFGAKAKGLAQGMSEEEAIQFAKKITRETQFNFGTIDTPVGMSSDIVKTLTQFQTFTTKQIEFLAEMAKNKEYAGLIRYTLGGLVFVYTIGQAFGMKPQDLIPAYRIGTPPSLKLPTEAVKAVTDMPDKYGQSQTATQKLENIGGTLPGYFPGGSQIKKSVQGYQAIKQGGSYDAAGRLQFPIGQSTTAKAQAILFGKYSSQEAKDYFNRGEITKQEKAKVQPIYDQVQSLVQSGDKAQAQSIIDSLSDADYATYQKVKSSANAEKVIQGKKDILPMYNDIQSLVKSGNEVKAQSIIDGMTDEQYKSYQAVKKDQEKLNTAKSGDKPTFNHGEVQSDRGVIETVWTYAKAIGTDPVTAFDRIFAGESIRYVTNGTIVVDRLPLSTSQAEKKAQGSTGAEVKLDHTIPLELGGTNDKSNLKLVPTKVWASYTGTENAIGKALRAGKINKSKAQSLISDFKNGKITAQDVTNLLK